MNPADRPVRPEGDDTPPGYEDPYDYPELPIEKRLFLAAHSDLGPEFLYGWGEGDGAYDTIRGLLADDQWRNEIAIANTMGLVGDWGTDDVHEAVTNALHEYRELKATPEAARRVAAEALADAVEDYAFTTDKDLEKLRAAWQAYVEAVDSRSAATPTETTEH